MIFKDEGFPDESKPMTKILIVDDDETVRRLLARLMEMSKYAYCLAANATEARSCMKEQSFELILCDMKMPGESGMDFIRYVFAEYPDTAVVMVTAVDDPEIAETAMTMGAYGYIIKPFKLNELMINVANALRRRQLEVDNRAYRRNLEQTVQRRTGELQETLEKLRKAMEGVIQAIALTVETRDPYTAGHQRRVADLACAMGKDLGLSSNRINGVRMAGIIHDLGKISVPAEILSKPCRLSALEYGIIKSHPQTGNNILREIDFPWPVAQIVLQHHERINGSGYPLGLTNGRILWEAKIIAVADVVEAMSSHRPYRPTLGINQALEEIRINRGILYDPEVADVCLRLFEEKEFNLHKENTWE